MDNPNQWIAWQLASLFELTGSPLRLLPAEDLKQGLDLYLQDPSNFNLMAIEVRVCQEMIPVYGEVDLGKILASPIVPTRVKEGLLQAQKEPKSPPGNKEAKGCVYLAVSAHHRYTKIGFSRNIEARQRSFTDDPSIRFIFVSAPRFSIENERFIHHKLRKQRYLGEWFDLEPPHIQRIKRYLKEEA